MKFINVFAYFVVSCLLADGIIIQYKYLNRVYFDCKTKLCLIPGMHGKYIFTQKVRDLYHQLPIKFHGFNRKITRVITLWFLVLSQFFRESMGPFNISNINMSLYLVLMPLGPTLTRSGEGCPPRFEGF